MWGEWKVTLFDEISSITFQDCYISRYSWHIYVHILIIYMYIFASVHAITFTDLHGFTARHVSSCCMKPPPISMPSRMPCSRRRHWGAWDLLVHVLHTNHISFTANKIIHDNKCVHIANSHVGQDLFMKSYPDQYLLWAHFVCLSFWRVGRCLDVW